MMGLALPWNSRFTLALPQPSMDVPGTVHDGLSACTVSQEFVGAQVQAGLACKLRHVIAAPQQCAIMLRWHGGQVGRMPGLLALS